MTKLLIDLAFTRPGLIVITLCITIGYYEGVPLGPAANIPFGVGQFLQDNLGGRVGHVAAEARKRAVDQLTKNFNNAVGDLTNEADKARVMRALCRERGGVYDFVTSECQQD